MTKKVTVADVFETHKTLTRYANYASRHMDANMPIAQMTDVIGEARKAMASALRTFEEMNVADLLPDYTELRNDIANAKRQIDYYENEVESDKENIKEAEKYNDEGEAENYREWLEKDEAYLAEWTAKLETYERELAEATAQ